LAQRHEEILALGARVFAIDIDSPAQHAAMVEKLELPFPMLSDPDRTLAIEPYGLSNPRDKRNLAYPAIVVVTSDGEEALRVVSRDFADRLPEDDLIARLEALELTPTTQDAPAAGPAEPGPRAMPIRAMQPYFRGARFAAVAMGMRHPSAKDDADAYVAQMDRFIMAVRELKARKAD
jgi:hypothetical protein